MPDDGHVLDLTDYARYGSSPRVEAIDECLVGLLSVEDRSKGLSGFAVALDLQTHAPNDIRQRGHILVATPEMAVEIAAAILGNTRDAVGADEVRAIARRRFPDLVDLFKGE